MALAPLLGLVLLAAHVEGDASASATAQVGTPATASDTNNVEPGLFVAATLSLNVSDPLEGVIVSYSPHFVVGNGQAEQLLHQGSILGHLRASAAQTLTLGESLTYGEQDFSPLAPSGGGTALPPPIDRLPPDEALRVFNSASTLGYVLMLSPLTKLTASSSFAIGGGLGSEARAELPLQRTGTFLGSLAWGLSKIDQMTFSLNGSLSLPDSTERAELAGAAFAWAHAVSSATSTSLQLGAAFLHDVGPIDSQQQPFVPTGSFSIAHSELVSGRALSLSLVTGAAPAVDPLSGAVYLRGSLTGSATWSPIDRLSLSISTSAAHGIGAGDQHEWGAQGSFTAAFRIPPSTSVSLGFRGAWLPPAEVIGQLSGYQWSIFSSVSWGDSYSF